MKPIRVLLIAPSMRLTGGQAVQADRLLEKLRAEPSLELTFQPIDPPLPPPLALLQRIPFVRTAVNEAVLLVSLFFRVPRADVLHIYSAADLSFYLSPTPALLAAKMFRRAAILNCHDGRAESQLRGSSLAPRILRLPDALVTPSDYLVEVFARYGLTAQSIFNIVDVERFRFRLRSPVRPVFLQNRGFEEHYDVACTLRAFGIIQRQFPGAALTLAHDGPLRPDLERLARELGLRNTRFIGRQPAAQMPAIYDEADIYLNTPRVDNMPVSLLEAFASGIPVVSTDAGGIPYLATDERTALLTRVGDHEAIAAASIRLLNEPDLALSLARAAFEEVQRYTWARIRDEWLGLYAALASHGRT
jgi:glycosyltransferase involved in cell wall biosynthesis